MTDNSPHGMSAHALRKYFTPVAKGNNLGYAAMTEDAMSGSGQDGVSAETLRSISAPDRVDGRLGTLEFRDGGRLRCRDGTS